MSTGLGAIGTILCFALEAQIPPLNNILRLDFSFFDINTRRHPYFI